MWTQEKQVVLRANLTRYPSDKILKTDSKAEKQRRIEFRALRLEDSKPCYETFPQSKGLTDPQERKESCVKVAWALAKLPIVGFDEEC